MVISVKIIFSAKLKLYPQTKVSWEWTIWYIIYMSNANKKYTYSSEHSYSIVSLRTISRIWLTPSLPNSPHTKFWQKLNLQEQN